MRVLIAAAEGRQLATDAERWGHQVVAVLAAGIPLESALAETMPDVAVVSAEPAVLTPGAIASADERGVRLVALVANDAERRHAAGLGLYEIADAGTAWAELEALVTGALPPSPATREPGTGSVVAVWGPAGAPGRTTVAVHLAAELALAGLRVALADVDTHGAAIAPTLGLLDEAPGFAAACRLASADALDRRELERVAQWYPLGSAGIWVLTGIGRPDRWPELSGERVRGVLAACRAWVDVTVLDTASSLERDEEISSDLFAPRRNGATIAAIEGADHVIAVGSADPVGIARLLRAHVDLVELRESSSVSVVMNRVRASVIGAAPATQVAQTLGRFGGIEPAALVPYDRVGFDAALLSGRTLAEVAPKSPARAPIQRLARTLAPGVLARA